jgi:hypothetical protein
LSETTHWQKAGPHISVKGNYHYGKIKNTINKKLKIIREDRHCLHFMFSTMSSTLLALLKYKGARGWGTLVMESRAGRKYSP